MLMDSCWHSATPTLKHSNWVTDYRWAMTIQTVTVMD
jgi:hypothetical protein